MCICVYIYIYIYMCADEAGPASVWDIQINKVT